MAALLEEAAWGKILSRHALNIALTVAVADWIYTLPFEIEVIWPTKWNLVKVLYILNRYFLVDMFVYYLYLERANIEFIVVQITACCVEGFFYKSVVYAPSPLPQHVACLPISGASYLAMIIFGLLMANETIILLAMVYIGFKKHRRMRSPLVTTFYRDGIVFFSALAGTSIVNIVLLLSLPPTSNTLFAICLLRLDLSALSTQS
ncbi:hypothetical protein EST38_g10303 [Candolleomyces aberdarensis]|uniref:DUF6533 domain-containing protein n=1 Tax=Candolleomyces aberdarensis TaxID=2316362 RepID=A0A4Q2DA59_9AGAR|nr:hypothetical protein EST38_g10303 [Candolleomyces aberdarensis]